MAKVLLLVGTRKGAFLLESDQARRDWAVRGPYCDSWPVFRVVHDASTGILYAAAASAWHGAGVWRSADLGESWVLSSEGIGFAADGLKVSKISGLAASRGRVLASTESAGLFASSDGGETFALVSTLDDQPGRDRWNNPELQPPGNLGMPGLLEHPDDPDHLWVVIQGTGTFETTDGGTTWTPRNRGLRADWPLPENAEVGFCVHKVVMSPDRDRLYQQNHVGMHRSDDAGRTWTEISEGLPTEFGLGAAAHAHDRDTFYVAPLDPWHARTMPGGAAAIWRTRDAGSTWTRLAAGLPQRNAYLGVLREGMASDALDVPGVYFGTTSGHLFASADEGDTWSEIASYLPAITSVEVAVID
jgi:photosystem II stability/assembly factor-like uncharacterized protein